FFFSSRRRHTRLQGDWSSDVCSSDLCPLQMIDVHILGCHFAEDIPFREDPHKVALVENEQAAGAGALHGLDGLPDGGATLAGQRSEERRVGKECRSRWSAGAYK